MAKIRLLTSIVGDDGVEGRAGAELEVEEKVAKKWADGVRAERIAEVRSARSPRLETQMTGAPENTALR